jgi:prepilin-type N-terminal cleavage/methylation domain-containing protein
MRRQTQRGFTLIEIMVSVAIVGVLSSVAMPSYQNMTLRTRKSERDVVMTSVKRSVGAVLIRDGRFDGEFTGLSNPPSPPATQKRPFDLTSDEMAPWRNLDLGIEGAVYHSYAFAAVGTGFTISAEGNLDGDLVSQFKVEEYRIQEGALMPAASTAEHPNPFFDPPGDVAF